MFTITKKNFAVQSNHLENRKSTNNLQFAVQNSVIEIRLREYRGNLLGRVAAFREKKLREEWHLSARNTRVPDRWGYLVPLQLRIVFLHTKEHCHQSVHYPKLYQNSRF